ncbi:TonB family protein [bacterium]|nr:TonB family protein [bacterium]
MSGYVMPGLPKYGAIELKEVHQKYLTRALIIAAVSHLLLVGLYWGSTVLGKEEPPTTIVKIVKYSDLGPPPSIAATEVAPAVSMAGPTAKPSIGIPVPVPDAEVSPEASFASQQDLSSMQSPVTTDVGGSAVIEQDIEVDEPPPAFVPFEKEPVCIKRVEPTYPEIAQKAGLEGSVYAKLWITKEGKVKEVVIMKSDSEIFNQAVIDAAGKWLFTPAMMKNGPVAVWLAVPFNFTLK